MFIYLTEFRDVILASNWHDPAGLCLFHQYCPIMGPESMYFVLIFQFTKLFDKSVVFFCYIFCYEYFAWIVFQCTLLTVSKLSSPIAQKPGNYRYFFHFLFHQLDDFSQCPRLRWVLLDFYCIYAGTLLNLRLVRLE